jgi:hypothetical protein
MKLSKETLDILKNFAQINPNLYVKGGQQLTTISEEKNIQATATIAENFETAFGIYDLNGFISAYDLIGDAELQFSERYVTLKNDRSKITYRFADESILTYPKKSISMPPADVCVTITEESLNKVRKAASVLRCGVVSIKGEAGKISFSVSDAKNSSSNAFETLIDTDNESKANFDLQFLISNLKLINGDYKVGISSLGISTWENTNGKINYFISLEKTSSYNA